MAVTFYDEALFNKIKKWVKDPNMQILKPEETSRLFEITADETFDKPLTLPIIALSRSKDIELLSTKKQPRSFAGATTEDGAFMLNVIPMKLGYQLDIYTKGMFEADEYVRNFVFNFVNYPHLTVDIPYNGKNLRHNATISLEESITDNSDIKEHLFADQFARFTLKLQIDDAYLFSVPGSPRVTLEGFELEVQDRTTDEIVETHTIP